MVETPRELASTRGAAALATPGAALIEQYIGEVKRLLESSERVRRYCAVGGGIVGTVLGALGGMTGAAWLAASSLVAGGLIGLLAGRLSDRDEK